MSTASLNRVAPLDQWTEPEKWIWEKVCNGEIADFNLKYQKEIEPETLDGWSEERLISPAFLETILLYDPYKSALPRRGLRISGAWIKEKIDLTNARLNAEWWTNNSRFEKPVDLSFLQTTDIISFVKSFFVQTLDLASLKSELSINISGIKISGALNMDSLSSGNIINMMRCKVEGKLNMASLSVKNHLLMGGEAEFSEINMSSAKIGGSLVMTGVKVKDKLDMDLLSVNNYLIMRGGAEFMEINMLSAKIGGQLDMTGAKVKGKLIMDSLSVNNYLIMRGGAEFMEINMLNAKIGGQLDMTGAKVKGKLNMDSLSVKSHLFMRDGAEFMEVNMLNAKIGGQLDMKGAKVKGKLDMESLSVNSYLIMRDGAEFMEINMRSAKIGGQLDMTGAKVKGKLNMDSLSANSHLFMRDGAEFMDVNMLNAKIGGQFDMTGIKIKESFQMELVSVTQNIFLRKAEFPQTVAMIDSDIEGSIIISSAKLFRLDLGGTTVRGELRIGSPGNKLDWTPNSFMNLCNTKVGALLDGGENSWPEKIDLDGFTCSGLGGFWGNESNVSNKDIRERDAKWFIKWLAKDVSYSPQPYYHLAEVLNKMGHSEKANAILFASKERERKEAGKSGHFWKWVGLGLLNLTIGYGFGARYFRSLIWVGALTIIGIFIIGTVETGEMRSASIVNKFGFSLHMVLPIIRLNDLYKLDFGGWQLYYFYFHKIMGFMLGSFVVAGLSGITKR
jgi:hypothetical protein